MSPKQFAEKLMIDLFHDLQDPNRHPYLIKELEDVIEHAVLEEREACAKIAESRAKVLDSHAELSGTVDSSPGWFGHGIAQSIRARTLNPKER